MNTLGRLVAGSHNRNELVLINAEESSRIKSMTELSDLICQICGDPVTINEVGEIFVACNECAFPVCYTYERMEGSQACPQCKTRYKRIKGCPRVDGDEDEDDFDDIYDELNCPKPRYLTG